METMWYQSKKEIKEIKICSIKKISVRSKVIIHKSHGEVSLVEQDTIENVSAAYLKFIIFFFAYKNRKKQPSKVAQNQSKSQFLFHKNCSPRDLVMYNDFELRYEKIGLLKY